MNLIGTNKKSGGVCVDNSGERDSQEMTFQAVSRGISCDCLHGAKKDTTSFFYRKLKRKSISSFDFLTHEEKEIFPSSDDCETVCSFRSVSVNQHFSGKEDVVFSKYRISFHLNPSRPGYCLKFSLKDGAGLVKPTPDSPDFHCDFFKSDQFEISNHLNIFDIIRIE